VTRQFLVGLGEMKGGGMFRLVQADVAASRKADLGERPPSFFLNRRANDVFPRQRVHLGLQIGAHEIELMAIILFCWMKGCLRWWQREDQPAVAGIDRCQPQHIAKEAAVCLSILAINDDMCARNHDGASVAPSFCFVDMR
jgi:hypothetical protein